MVVCSHLPACSRLADGTGGRMRNRGQGNRRLRATSHVGHRRAVSVLVTLLVLGALSIALSVSGALASSTTYSESQVIPVPPSSSFAGSSGGDGWALALSKDKG